MSKKEKEDKFIQPALAKRMLKANKKVGKLTKGVPDVVAFAGEVFLSELVEKTTKNGTTELSALALAETIKANQEYDFLLPLIPEIMNASAEESNKRKKEKAEDDE